VLSWSSANDLPTKGTSPDASPLAPDHHRCVSPRSSLPRRGRRGRRVLEPSRQRQQHGRQAGDRRASRPGLRRAPLRQPDLPPRLSRRRRDHRHRAQLVVDPLGGGGATQQAQGSGWVYDTDGHIVTNDHVVDGATSIKVRFSDGKTYSATTVGTDRSTDLAVIKVDAPSSELYPLSVGDSTQLQVGDGVVSIGSPFGLEETVTSGIVSALHRAIQGQTNFTINDSIQTDAAINHGNSGGPLLNTQGQVVGVNAQIKSDSGGNEGVGFSIPSKTVKSVASQLIATGKATHAYLGVAIDSTAPNARLASVKSGGAAQKAGLKAGDVITDVNGNSIASGDDLSRAIDAHKPGQQITVTYTRSGNEHTVTVTLGTRPN